MFSLILMLEILIKNLYLKLQISTYAESLYQPGIYDGHIQSLQAWPEQPDYTLGEGIPGRIGDVLLIQG